MRILNLSVWETVEDLRAFTYDERHVSFMRRRRAWFEAHVDVYFVMWWVPAGHEPPIEEAEGRLAMIASDGPSRDAFNFMLTFPPPGQ